MMDKLNRCFFNTIWDKVSGDIKKDYDKIFLKTKIKSYGNEVTDF